MQVLKADISKAARKASEAQGVLLATRTMPGLVSPDDKTWWRWRAQKSGQRLALSAWAMAGALLASIGGLLLRQPTAPSTASPSPFETPTAETLPAASDGAPVSTPSPKPEIAGPASSPPSRQRSEHAVRTLPAGPPARTESRPAAEALPSAAPAPGTLKVTSTPPASVVLDGDPKGPTPLSLSALAPGPHALVLTTDDGRTYQERISIASGETVERDHRFPGFGGLSITSEVWVEVSVDGGPTYQTPCRIERLLAGRHVIRASRAGYREQTMEVEVREGETERVRLVLEKQP